MTVSQAIEELLTANETDNQLKSFRDNLITKQANQELEDLAIAISGEL